MFACSGSSPMVLSGKTKQTLLDSFGRPPTRLTRRTATEKGSGAAKLSSKQKKATHQEQSSNLEGACQEGADSPTAQGFENTVLGAKEGRAFLEEEAIINSEDQIDVDVLSGALVQITLREGMILKASHAVHSVMLILAQVRIDSISNSILKSMEAKMSTIVDKATEKMEAVVNGMTEGLKAAAQGLTNNTVKLTKTTASYRDILAGAGPHISTAASAAPIYPPTMTPRLQAREGVRVRQVLIDIDGCTGSEAEALSTSSISALKRKLNEALGSCSVNGTPISHTRPGQSQGSRLGEFSWSLK